MQFFIDTANVEEIREVSSWGIIDGVTTNPSLVAKEGRTVSDVVKEIASLIDGPISAEVREGSALEMIKEAQVLAKIHPNIVIKLPMTIEGIKACKKLTAQGIKTNVTLVFSVTQAVAAAKAGATYVSPFMGRLDDITLGTGAQVVEEIAEVFDLYGYKTKIIAASIRNVNHAREALLAGADVATIPYKVLVEMLKHPLTDKGLAIFAAASGK